MRNGRPRWRTEVNIRTMATGTQTTKPAMRHHSGGGPSGRRQKKAMKIARHSSSRPARVAPIAVMEGRFWLCGAIKKNGYDQMAQDTTLRIQRRDNISLLKVSR